MSHSAPTRLVAWCIRPDTQLASACHFRAPRVSLIPASGVMSKEVALATLVLTALAAVGSVSAAEQVEFTPADGFAGESEGIGTLKMFAGKARDFHVQSRGSKQRDGTFHLEQRVTFEGKPCHERVWIMTPVSSNRYSATLSDAAGAVTGTTSGPRLSLHYRVKGPLFMRQELELMPDGKTINNVGKITLVGIPVGHLHETITRNGPGTTSTSSTPSGCLASPLR